MAYVFLIVVALIVVAGIVYAVVNWTSQERVEAASPRWQVGPVEGRVEPEQRHDSRPGFCRRADSLAAAGQYEEAAHVLLLGTIDQLVQVSGRDHPRSQTSRELVERLRLDSPQRQALGGLVNAVERTLFGGRPLTATTFEFCRRKVQTLVAGTSL